MNYVPPKKYLISCMCDSNEHIAIWSHDKGDVDEVVVLDIFLNPDFRVLKRIVHAIKYIFGYKCKYGDFDGLVLSYEGVKDLRDLCNTAIMDVDQILREKALAAKDKPSDSNT